MQSGDVIFKGVFDLKDALNDFGKFAVEIERRLRLLTRKLGQEQNAKTENRVLELMGLNQKFFADAERKVVAFKRRVNDAIGKGLIEPQKAESVMQGVDNRLNQLQVRYDRLNYKIQENIKFTKADILALRQMNNELNNYENRLQKAERTLAQTNVRIQESAKRFNEFFRSMVIGGFALQQLGGFLIFNVTQPLIRLGQALVDTTLKFDTLETLLRERGKKSIDEIATSMDLVGSTAKLRNLDLEGQVTLYTRIFEATRGLIDNKTFETISKGLSQVMSTIESGEKRAFFGQIQDILGGGDVANLEKTLSLAPALKTVYDEIDKATGGALSQQELLIKSFERLAEMPALNDLATKVKNLGVQFELWGYRISRIYKDDLAGIVDFIEQRLFPVIEKLLVKFENMSPFLQNLVPVLLAITVALGPVIYTLGTLGVVAGGVAYVVRGLATGLAALTGSTVAAKLAAADLTTLLASTTAGGGGLAKVAAFLPRIVAMLNPITLAIAALSAAVGYIVYNDIGNAQTGLRRLMDTVLFELGRTLETIALAVGTVSLAIGKLFGLLDNKTTPMGALGLVIGGLVGLLGELLSALIRIFALPWEAVRTLLEIIYNFFNDGLPMGLAKSTVSLLEFQQTIRDVHPWLRKLFEWIEQLDPEQALSKRLADARQRVKELGGETVDQNKKVKDSTDNLAQSQLNFVSKTNSATDAIKKLNDALVNQRDALQDANYNYGRYLATASTKRSDAAGQRAIKGLDEQIGDFDLTDPEQRAKAANIVNEANRANLLRAKQKQERDNYVQLQDELKKQRDSLVKLFENETDVTMKQLYVDIVKIYDKHATNVNQIFPSIAEYLMQKGETMSQVMTSQRIKEYFQIQSGQIKMVVKMQEANQEEVEKAQLDNQDRIKAFNQRVKDSEQARQAAQGEITLSELVGSKEGQVERLRLDQKRFLEENQQLLSMAALRERLASDRESIVKLYDDIRDAELKNIEQSLDTQLDQDKAKAEVWRKYHDSVGAAMKEEGDVYDAIQGTLIKQGEDNRKRLVELILSSRQNDIDQLNLLNELGQSSDKLVGRIKTKTNFANQFDIVTSMKSLFSTADLLKTSTAKFDPKTTKPVLDFLGQFEKFEKDWVAGAVDESKISKMIAQAEQVAQFLRYIGSLEFDSEENKADFERVVANVLKFTESLKAAKSDMDKVNELDLSNLKAKEIKLERQLDINSELQNELQLHQEILSVQKDRGYAVDLKGMSTFGKDILNVISGGQIAFNKLQREIFERQKEAARLELSVALTRLDIEQRIFELKVKALEISDAEKQKMIEEQREQTELMKESLIRQGELQQILLQEQIDSLNGFAGGIGQIILASIGSAIDSLFGKKKEKEDEEGSVPDDALGGGALLLGDHDMTDAEKKAAKLQGMYKKVAGAAGAFGKALMEMNDLSAKSIRNALAEALNAIAVEAGVKALQYAAIALSALVFGDFQTAGKAAVAAAAWTGVALAAKAGADLIGVAESTSTSNAQSNSARASGSTDTQAERDILKQKALSIFINLDIRTDDGIIIKKNVKAINQNTQLANLTMNGQEGWAFSPTP